MEGETGNALPLCFLSSAWWDVLAWQMQRQRFFFLPPRIWHSCTCARVFWLATSPLWPQGCLLMRAWKRPKQADVAKWETDFVWFSHNHSQFLNNFTVYNLPPSSGLSSWSYRWFSPNLSIPLTWTSCQKSLRPSVSIRRVGDVHTAVPDWSLPWRLDLDHLKTETNLSLLWAPCAFFPARTAQERRWSEWRHRDHETK